MLFLLLIPPVHKPLSMLLLQFIEEPIWMINFHQLTGKFLISKYDIMIRTIPSHPLTRQTTCPHQLRVHRPDVSVAFVHALRQIHIQRSLFEDGGRTGPLQFVSSVARVFQERARKVFEVHGESLKHTCEFIVTEVA